MAAPTTYHDVSVTVLECKHPNSPEWFGKTPSVARVSCQIACEVAQRKSRHTIDLEAGVELGVRTERKSSNEIGNEIGQPLSSTAQSIATRPVALLDEDEDDAADAAELDSAAASGSAFGSAPTHNTMMGRVVQDCKEQTHQHRSGSYLRFPSSCPATIQIRIDHCGEASNPVRAHLRVARRLRRWRSRSNTI